MKLLIESQAVTGVAFLHDDRVNAAGRRAPWLDPRFEGEAGEAAQRWVSGGGSVLIRPVEIDGVARQQRCSEDHAVDAIEGGHSIRQHRRQGA